MVVVCLFVCLVVLPSESKSPKKKREGWGSAGLYTRTPIYSAASAMPAANNIAAAATPTSIISKGKVLALDVAAVYTTATTATDAPSPPPTHSPNPSSLSSLATSPRKTIQSVGPLVVNATGLAAGDLVWDPSDLGSYGVRYV